MSEPTTSLSVCPDSGYCVPDHESCRTLVLPSVFFRYSDGDLILIYPGGSKCSSGFERMTIINFECNKTARENTSS